MSGRALSDLSTGESAVVVDVGGEARMRVRLLEMGFVPGTRVKLLKRAPWGDPLQFVLRGYHISLRKTEAARIEVTDGETP